MKPNIIIVNPKDNVAIALTDISKGEKAALKDGRRFVARTDIPFSHKMLLEDLPGGENIIKYGEVIGRTSVRLSHGEWIHTHNLDNMGE